MKKIIYGLILICSIVFAGCFETMEETLINKDGSGTFSNTIDLSSMVAVLKQMGGDDAQKMGNTDTTISLAGLTDSINGFTPEQKKVISQGHMRLLLNMEKEQLLVKLSLPFQKVSDIQMLQQVLPKLTQAAMKKLPGTEQMPPGMRNEDTSNVKTFDDFFDVSYSDKVISKTLNKDKYAAAKDGDYMKSLQQVSEMGSPIKANYVFDLPRPAKKAEGKALKLSDDKKKITVNVTSDDFMTDPSKFEYRIEY